MNNFATENILNFIPTRGWSEEQRISFSLKFVELFHVYLAKMLDSQLPGDADNQLQQVLGKQQSEKEIIDFYNKLFPQLSTHIDEASIEFKKIYILNLYSNKLKQLETEIYKKKMANAEVIEEGIAYKNWTKINKLANQDKWEEVLELISQLK